MSDAPRVQIHYRRPPDRIEVFDQRVLHETEDVIVTLAEAIQLSKPVVVEGETILESGSSAVWFTFPGAWHDIGRFHRADGTYTGCYANVLTPARIDGRTWYTTDLYLDVWAPPGGALTVLDQDELAEALSLGHVDEPTGRRARDEVEEILRLHEQGLWPPPIVGEWTLEQATGP